MSEILVTLHDCGVINDEFVEKKDCFRELEELLKNKEIEEVYFEKTKVYQITEVGEKSLQLTNPEKKFFYRCFFIEKQLRILEHYNELTEEERKTWKTKDEVLTLLDYQKPLDAIYESNGKKIGIYVINNKFNNKNLINLIEQTAQILEIDNVHYLTF